MKRQHRRPVPTYAHPTRLSRHAEERWHERWRPAWRHDFAADNLRELLPRAELVEIDHCNLQAIWRLPAEDGHRPLLVVDAQGLVRTVLPRGAKKSDRR